MGVAVPPLPVADTPGGLMEHLQCGLPFRDQENANDLLTKGKTIDKYGSGI